MSKVRRASVVMRKLLVTILKVAGIWLLLWPLLTVTLIQTLGTLNEDGLIEPTMFMVFGPFLLCVFVTYLFFRNKMGRPMPHLFSARKQERRAEFERESDQKAREREDLERLVTLVNQHERALVRNWHKHVHIDDYGTKSFSDWNQEVIKFLQSTQYRALAIENDLIPSVVTDLVNDLVEDSDIDSIFDYDEISSAYDFEEKCAEELSYNGWNTKLTSGSGDQGVDVLAEKNGVRVVVQCKLYSSAVGNKAVQEALAGMAFEKADYAVVVAPNGYTRSAKELADRTNVLLLSQNDLKVLDRYLEK